MKTIQNIFLTFACCITISAYGITSNNKTTLEKERLETVREYLKSLGSLNSTKINMLFEKNGKVISTSKGEIDSKIFFKGFLSELTSADIKDIYIYKAINDKNHYGAKFNFGWIEKNGTAGGGVYMDDFIFTNGSKKLEKVIMFENKQL